MRSEVSSFISFYLFKLNREENDMNNGHVVKHACLLSSFYLYKFNGKLITFKECII
jgi:hypothetical protein